MGTGEACSNTFNYLYFVLSQFKSATHYKEKTEFTKLFFKYYFLLNILIIDSVAIWNRNDVSQLIISFY